MWPRKFQSFLLKVTGGNLSLPWNKKYFLHTVVFLLTNKLEHNIDSKKINEDNLVKLLICVKPSVRFYYLWNLVWGQHEALDLPFLLHLRVSAKHMLTFGWKSEFKHHLRKYSKILYGTLAHYFHFFVHIKFFNETIIFLRNFCFTFLWWKMLLLMIWRMNADTLLASESFWECTNILIHTEKLEHHPKLFSSINLGLVYECVHIL